MFDHVKFGVSDYAASKAFFCRPRPAWRNAGRRRRTELRRRAGRQRRCFSMPLSKCGKPAPLHIAFRADSREQVDAFWQAALAAGGKDNGAPGLRPNYHASYYAAFVIAPDGHNIEAVCHLAG